MKHIFTSIIFWINKIIRFSEAKTTIWIAVKFIYSFKVRAWTAVNSKRIIGLFFKHGVIDIKGYVSIFERIVDMLLALEKRPDKKWLIGYEARLYCINLDFSFHG